MKNLTTIMYELWEDGFIYDEDENGAGMSYGEYSAVNSYMLEHVEEMLEHADSLEEALDIYDEVVTQSDDDAWLYCNIEEDYRDISWLIYTDENDIYRCDYVDEIPFERLKELYLEYAAEHEDCDAA